MILALVSAYFGAKWQNAKGKAESVAALINKIIIAAKDDQVSEEEFQQIVDAAKAVVQ